MLIIVHVLLVLKIGGCTADPIFETKTVDVGHNVTLTCDRRNTRYSADFYWIRFVSGTFPEVLGGTVAYDLDYDETRRITAKQEPGEFVLHILETRLSDTAIYYCIKVTKFKMAFLKGTFLRIKGPEPVVTTVTQDSLSDPVRPGDSVTLQCSVLSDSQNKPCPGDHSVFWFRTGSESNSSFIYSHENSGDECEASLEARSPQKCVYSFSKNVSSSDAGTYYCAVATCGEILFGNGTKLDFGVSVIGTCDSDNIIVLLLCAAVAVSLIVIGVLVYSFKKKSCDCCNAVVTPQTNAATVSGDQQSQQRNEDALVYSQATFTQRKPGKSGRRRAREEETIYSDVRTFVRD